MNLLNNCTLLQLEEEAINRFEKIMEENVIILITEDLPNPWTILELGLSLILLFCVERLSKNFFSNDDIYTKKKLFFVQAGTENAIKRAILRYFWRELVIKGTIDRKNILQRFNK